MDEIQTIVPRRSSFTDPFEAQVRTFTRDLNYQNAFTRAVRQQEANPKKKVRRFFRGLIGRSSNKPQLPESYLALIEKGSSPYQIMLRNVLRGTNRKIIRGQLDPNSRETTKALSNKRHPIEKTGSQLEVLYNLQDPENPINGVMINTIPTRNARVWEKLATGEIQALGQTVAVAPILMREFKDGGVRPRIRHFKNGNSVVASRYCGLPFELLYDDRDGYSFENRGSHHINLPPDLNQEIIAKHNLITAQLEELNIEHGHPHFGNFTYEMISRSWMEERFAQGENINTITYNPEAWSFNIMDKIEYPDDWEVVVRLIDFDRAYVRKTPSDGIAITPAFDAS